MGRDDSAARDLAFLASALQLARRGLGTTSPNPSVAALVVDEQSGEIIARGATQPGGRPHAETEALRRAGERARGATLYVTLEPCSHYGRTAPCADAIIAAGIARVVAAIEDPDPRVAGRGLDRLRKAGIGVTSRLLTRETHWLARGHIVRLTERRPFIQLKLALDAIGSVARGGAGRPAWVTGPDARARGHLMRARTDAILVGRQTVLDDDPELTCRLPGLSARSPIRVILAKSAAGLLDSKLVRAAAVGPPVWIFCRRDPDVDIITQLERSGARVFGVPVIAGQLWLPAVLETLVAEGLTRLLVEGGPTMWRAFADAGLVDEVAMFHARPEGALPTGEAVHSALAQFLGPTRLEMVDRRGLSTDDMFIFRKPLDAPPLDHSRRLLWDREPELGDGKDL